MGLQHTNKLRPIKTFQASGGQVSGGTLGAVCNLDSNLQVVKRTVHAIIEWYNIVLFSSLVVRYCGVVHPDGLVFAQPVASLSSAESRFGTMMGMQSSFCFVWLLSRHSSCNVRLPHLECCWNLTREGQYTVSNRPYILPYSLWKDTLIIQQMTRTNASANHTMGFYDRDTLQACIRLKYNISSWRGSCTLLCLM